MTTTDKSRADALTDKAIPRDVFYRALRAALKRYRSDHPSRYLNDDQVDADDSKFASRLADDHAKNIAASPVEQPAAAPIDEPVAAWINYPVKTVDGEFAGYEKPELAFTRPAYGYDITKAEPLYRRPPTASAPSPADERAARAEAALRALEDELTDRDPSKTNAEQGLFRKFDVRRVDGSDQPGGKHHGCEYFVFDMNHDGYARAALRAYARACAAEFPILAADLIKRYALDGTPVLCCQCRGCGDNDAAPGHCVRCNGSGIEPHPVSQPDAAQVGSALSASPAIVREIRRLADEHINNPKLSMELLAIANELARAASANETGAEGTDAFAHEVWSAAQRAPGEGIEDAVQRVAAILSRSPAMAAEAVAIPAGYALVPIEPTTEMLSCWWDGLPKGTAFQNCTPRGVYAAMLAVAPQPAQADARVGLTDEQRVALETALSLIGLSGDPRVRKMHQVLRALLQGANHAE